MTSNSDEALALYSAIVDQINAELRARGMSMKEFAALLQRPYDSSSSSKPRTLSRLLQMRSSAERKTARDPSLAEHSHSELGRLHKGLLHG